MTFGCPRVGDDGFEANLRRLVPRHRRQVNDQDGVARLPAAGLGYRDAGDVLRFTHAGALAGAAPGWLDDLHGMVDAVDDSKAVLAERSGDHSMEQYVIRVRRAYLKEDELSA